MIRSQKSEEQINSEINQHWINFKHDKYTFQEILHCLISQREALIALSKKQSQLITKVKEASILDPKINIIPILDEIDRDLKKINDALIA